ncbi:MAG: hypothetical protein JO060_00160 [Candidatus Eremiobacteraeota bacterium]|nr:hypothetical protein [Candidatus Eremiobacteraeota bacterium]
MAPAALARLEPGGRLVAIAPGSGLLRVRSGALVEDVPLRVVAGLAALRVEPPDPNPAPSATVDFKSVGLERSNAPVLIDGAVRWSTTTGSIASDGRYHAASRDAIVSARAGGRVAQADVRVGRSELVLMNFAAGRRWTFSTYPAGGRGTVTTSAERGESVLELSYDFSGDVRGAYANTALFLQGAPLAMSIEVRGDGAGVGVRAAFTNADGDRIAVTLARRADWQGYRRCEVSLPATAAPPLTLRALYVVPSLGTGRPARASGAVAFRDLRFEVAGSAGARS